MKISKLFIGNGARNNAPSAGRDQVLTQLLRASRFESSSATAIDELENNLKNKMRILPILQNEELGLSLDTAILSMRGWLLAFGAVALLLFSFSVRANYKEEQLSNNVEEVLTSQIEPVNQDTLVLAGDVEYGR
jgi:hypothetical protein